MPTELCIGEFDRQSAEHRSVGAKVRAERIEQRSVPVEEDSSGREAFGFHLKQITKCAARILMSLGRREQIVAVKINIVK